jgi:hypothetical protein
MRKKVKKYSGITDSFVKNVVPAQIRTFVSTLAGSREPITEENFTEKELQQARDAITSSRAAPRQKLPSSYTEDPVTKKMVPTYGPIDETVGYGDYRNKDTRGSDFSVLPSDAMRNTLGRFRYEKTPKGRLVATDNYDFKDDLAKSVPGVRLSSAYKNMSNLEKLRTLAKDTFSKELNPDNGPAMGYRTLPSRVGSAFIGDTKRPVRIDLGDAPYKKGGVIRGGGIERKGKTKGRFV